MFRLDNWEFIANCDDDRTKMSNDDRYYLPISDDFFNRITTKYVRHGSKDRSYGCDTGFINGDMVGIVFQKTGYHTENLPKPNLVPIINMCYLVACNEKEAILCLSWLWADLEKSSDLPSPIDPTIMYEILD